MDAFLDDFDLYFAKLFDGLRHDSGRPAGLGGESHHPLPPPGYRPAEQDPGVLRRAGHAQGVAAVPRATWQDQRQLRHRHQPDLRHPGSRADEHRPEDDGLQRPSGGEDIRRPGKTNAATRTSSPTSATSSTCRPNPFAPNGSPNMQQIQRDIAQALQVQPPFQSEADVQAEIARRIAFIQQCLKDSGLKTLVLGISGGVDSLTAGLLAQRAVEQLRERPATRPTASSPCACPTRYSRTRPMPRPRWRPSAPTKSRPSTSVRR